MVARQTQSATSSLDQTFACQARNAAWPVEASREPAKLPSGKPGPTNAQLAQVFLEVADLLQRRGENQFRIGRYCSVARVLLSLDRPAAEILAERGTPGLLALSEVGPSLASSIQELVRTGDLQLRQRLRDELSASPTATKSKQPF